MILPFKLHQKLAEITNKTLLSTASDELVMYRFNAPESINILGQIPEHIFLYYHQERLVTVFVKLKNQAGEKVLLKELEDAISDALCFLPEALPTGSPEGFKWETDVETLTLLDASDSNPISLYLADRIHSVF